MSSFPVDLVSSLAVIVVLLLIAYRFHRKAERSRKEFIEKYGVDPNNFEQVKAFLETEPFLKKWREQKNE